MKARKARTQLIRLDKASFDMYSNPVQIKEASDMPRQATYTYVRDNLARLLQEVE